MPSSPAVRLVAAESQEQQDHPEDSELLQHARAEGQRDRSGGAVIGGGGTVAPSIGAGAFGGATYTGILGPVYHVR